ncbi:hypothetical protein RN001_000090 [Aquatica leii]|uniref:Uncharacterized protein n=1 Tax=Aquatica leii TaxID=1421715 RepID=A0AAN7Q2L8_9COLE|nr:hypothetical protein RN001_000090 [Aquatica leii]
MSNSKDNDTTSKFSAGSIEVDLFKRKREESENHSENIRGTHEQMKKQEEEIKTLREELKRRDESWQIEKYELQQEIKIMKKRLEAQEKNSKKNNIIIKGTTAQDNNLKEWVTELIKKENIFIDSDLTYEEQKTQAIIRKIAKEEKNKGNSIKVSYKKLEINGEKTNENTTTKIANEMDTIRENGKIIKQEKEITVNSSNENGVGINRKRKELVQELQKLTTKQRHITKAKEKDQDGIDMKLEEIATDITGIKRENAQLKEKIEDQSKKIKLLGRKIRKKNLVVMGVLDEKEEEKNVTLEKINNSFEY